MTDHRGLTEKEYLFIHTFTGKFVKQLFNKDDNNMEKKSVKETAERWLKNFVIKSTELDTEKKKLIITSITEDCKSVAQDIIDNGEKQLFFYLNDTNENKKKFSKLVLENSRS